MNTRPDFTAPLDVDARMLESRDRALRYFRTALLARDADAGTKIDAVIAGSATLSDEEIGLLAFGLLKSLPWEVADQVARAALYDLAHPVEPLMTATASQAAKDWARLAPEVEIRAHVWEGIRRLSPRSIQRLKEKLGGKA
jgi:hypothetical protein